MRNGGSSGDSESVGKRARYQSLEFATLSRERVAADPEERLEISQGRCGQCQTEIASHEVRWEPTQRRPE